MAVSAELRRNAALVLVAGVVFLALQALLTGFALPLQPLERGFFPGLETEDLWVLRLIMMLVSSAGLVFAFRAWVRPAGKAAWAAAGIVAVSWLPVHLGVQARPELLVALACVAAAGHTTRWLVERDRAALIPAAIAVTVGVVLDPAMAGAAVGALTAVALVWARAHSGPALIALGAGVAVGATVATAVRRAVELDAAGVQRMAAAALLDPAAGIDAAALYRVLAGAVVLLGLAVLGMLWQRWPHRHNAARVGAAVAAVLFLTATSSVTVTPPRILPAFATLAVAAGAGLLAAWRRSRELGTPVATAVYVLVVAAYAVWQGASAAAAA